jgi:bifunctional oligoribonuclease and PAP phosphatase NrnA
MIKKLRDNLLRSKGILIVAHKDPDVDAIGSALALSLQLKKRDIPVVIWMADYSDGCYSFLPNILDIKNNIPDKYHFDTIVSLDSSNLQRIPDFETLEYSKEDVTLINIDHHADNSNFGNTNFVKDTASSVGEILYWLFEDFQWEITKDIAYCLYAAISYDTGRFMFSNVSDLTHAAASQLVKAGVDVYELSSHMYENKTLDTFEVMKSALNNLIVSEEFGYAFTTIPANVEMGEFKLIDFIRQLGGIDVVLVFQEKSNNSVKINLRSKNQFNVSSFAAQFGGGGHIKAAGITMTGSLKNVVQEVLANLEHKLIRK